MQGEYYGTFGVVNIKPSRPAATGRGHTTWTPGGMRKGKARKVAAAMWRAANIAGFWKDTRSWLEPTVRKCGTTSACPCGEIYMNHTQQPL